MHPHNGLAIALPIRSLRDNNRLFVIPSWQLVIVRLGLDQADRRWSSEAEGEFLRRVGEARIPIGAGPR